MDGAHEQREEPRRASEIDDSQFPSAEKRLELFRLTLPNVAILATLREAFGADTDIYQDMEGIYARGPRDPYDDICRFDEWINLHSWVFQDLPEIPVVASPTSDTESP